MPRTPADTALLQAILKSLQHLAHLSTREAYGVEDMAAVLGVSEGTVKTHVLPNIRTLRIGTRVLVRRDVLLEWLRKQEGIEARVGDVARQEIREALGLSATGYTVLRLRA